jgi:CxxC motif-containing protein
LRVDEENGYAVTGNACPRGEVYGKEEIRNPTRVLTSTVRIEGAALRRCPVKTGRAIPKGLLPQAMRALDDVLLVSPVRAGDVVLADLCGTGVDVVVTRSL